MLPTLRLAALIMALVCPIPAVAQGIKFGSDFNAALEKAKKDNKLVLIHFTQKESPDCAQMIKSVFSQPAIAEYVSKKFVAVRASGSETADTKVFQQFGVKIVPTIMVLDPQGQELMHAHTMNVAEFSKFLETSVELQTALEALAKVKKDKPAALSNALKRIGEFEAVMSKKVLREYAENEDLPDPVRCTAIDGLSHQKETLGDLVPFLGQKSRTVRTTAFNALKASGVDAVPALLDGLDGYAPEQRVNCFILVAALTTKSPKIAKDANFWRTGMAEDREKAVKTWKEWVEKNKGK